MSGYHNDSDTKDYGSHSRGSSSSHSSGKEHQIDAAKLGDMIIADGHLFGVQMPQETINAIRKIIPVALFILTDKGQDLITKKFDAKTGRIAGLAIALLEQISETVQNLYDLVTSLDNLHATMRPAAKAAGSASALTMNNEAIDDLRSKIINLFMHRMMDTVVGAIGAIPNLLLVYSKGAEKSKKFEAIEEIQATNGDPNKLAEVFDAEFHGGGKTGGATSKGLTGKQLQEGERVWIAAKKAEYKQNYDAFRLAEAPKMKTTLTTAVNALNETEYELQLINLKNLGVPGEALNPLTRKISDLEKMSDRELLAYRSKYKKTSVTRSDDRKEAIDEFKKMVTAGKNIDKFAEDALRTQYVREHGAFSTEDLRFADDETRKKGTIESELKEFRKKQAAEHQKLQKESDEILKEKGLDSKFKQFLDTTPSLIAGFARDFIIQLVGGKSLAKLQKPLAAERVAHLAKVLKAPADEPNWTPPKEVPPLLDKNSKGSKNNDESLSKPQSYSRYIHEIFQAQLAYHTRAEVGSRFTPNFDKVRWDDEAIRKMPDDKLSSYEYAIKHITRRVVDGQLSVSAILNFIGDRNGNRLFVHTDGQTFGPIGAAGKPDAEVKAGILKIIDDNTTSIRVEHSISPEQLSEKMSKWIFQVDSVKQVLESKDNDPEWRVFTFKLFSDVVNSDTIVCEKLGINSERCQELRKASKEYNEMLDGVVSVIAQKLEENPDNIASIFNNEDEKKFIKAMNSRLKEQGGHAANLTYTPEESAMLMTIAMNAVGTVGLQTEFQQDVRLASEELKKPREAAPKNDRAMLADHRTGTDSDHRSLRDKEPPMDRDIEMPGNHDSEEQHDSTHRAKPDRYGSQDEPSNADEKPLSHADRVGKRHRVDAPHQHQEQEPRRKARNISVKSHSSVESHSGGFVKRLDREESDPVVRGGGL